MRCCVAAMMCPPRSRFLVAVTMESTRAMYFASVKALEKQGLLATQGPSSATRKVDVLLRDHVLAERYSVRFRTSMEVLYGNKVDNVRPR